VQASSATRSAGQHGAWPRLAAKKSARLSRRLMRVKEPDAADSRQCSNGYAESSTDLVITHLARRGRGATRMSEAVELDVRGLEPPEPLARVLAALDALPRDGALLLKIDCRPVPLYRILERNGYAYEERPGAESMFEITIRLREGV
jgi:uncharacterized protein (DUF2249 family)